MSVFLQAETRKSENNRIRCECQVVTMVSPRRFTHGREEEEIVVSD